MQVLFGRGLVTNYLLTILTSISFEDCKNECACRPSCELVLYDRRLQLCELHTDLATRAENIVKAPGSIVVTNIDACDSCIRDTESTVSECPHPEQIGYILHRGNMFSVGSSVIVIIPPLMASKRVICSSKGVWKLDTEPEYCSDCRDCTDIQARGNTKSGVYFVNETFYFQCTFDDSGDAWLTFQKRFDGSVSFNNNWTDYVNGFGFMEGEFWLGLERLYRILSLGNFELRIDLETFDGTRYYAQYSTFDLADASDSYRISYGGYTGTAGDGLKDFHNGMQFSTYDKDNDSADSVNCAYRYEGAWWYRNCYYSSLNSLYNTYIHWHPVTGFGWSFKKTEMKIKRRLP